MSGEGGGCGDGEAADQDESSSSSHAQQGIEELLENFRQKWQRELEPSPPPSPAHAAVNAPSKPPQQGHDQETDETAGKEAKAGQLFLQGVALERDGKLNEAISCYRRAVQLVPDIEGRLYAQEVSRTAQHTPQHTKKEKRKKHLEDEEPFEDLVAKFTMMQNVGDALCQPEFETKYCNICQLPPELLAMVLRWVVSSQLDLIALENCSLVCRGFYLAARSDEIWRLICARVWGSPGIEMKVAPTWRDEYISRFRLHFNGCYISRTTYIRSGEQSFQDSYYNLWHAVQYYRYIRFFPGGLALMLTSADEPATALVHLRNPKPRNPAVMVGRYTLCGPRIQMELRPSSSASSSSSTSASNNNNNNNLSKLRFRSGRRRLNDVVQHDSGEKTFHVELQVNPFKNRNNVQLTWVRYCVETKYRAAPVTVCPFDLCPSKFPPLWFSRVLSYTGPSEACL